jgi:hypothetical protein
MLRPCSKKSIEDARIGVTSAGFGTIGFSVP